MKATDCIVKLLEDSGIEYIFGYQGGMVTHLIDSLSKSKKVKYIQCYHEQSAAIAAEGYAIESGKFGVAISTSGPGATNMITGIADAFFDSIPVLYITGQVNTYEYKYEKPVRQLGFQETDIVSIVKPITKYAKLVTESSELEYELNKAITIATASRKGPVVLDLPMDIQRSDLNVFKLSCINNNEPILEVNKSIIEEAKKALSSAKRPLVICGNGIIQAKSKTFIQNFLSKTNIPYVVSMLGKSSVSEKADNFYGVIGSYGNRCSNIIFSQADVVLALGTRLDLRQTGNVNSESLKKIKFIHVDIDQYELDCCKVQNKLNVHCDVKSFINNLKIEDLKIDNNWISFCKSIKNDFSQENDIKRFTKMPEPYKAIKAIRENIKEDCVFITDVGQNQVWCSQALNMNDKDSFISSGGLAPMGFAIPCAVGVSFANRNKKVVCITGDGGFHFALQSLMLISQYNLNIVIYVLNNTSLGMITQFQSLYFDSNMAGTTNDGGYKVPNIEKIAESYGLKYKYYDAKKLTNVSSLSGYIYEIKLPELTTVVPKLEYNKELYNMIPYLTQKEIDKFGLHND